MSTFSRSGDLHVHFTRRKENSITEGGTEVNYKYRDLWRRHLGCEPRQEEHFRRGSCLKCFCLDLYRNASSTTGATHVTICCPLLAFCELKGCWKNFYNSWRAPDRPVALILQSLTPKIYKTFRHDRGDHIQHNKCSRRGTLTDQGEKTAFCPVTHHNLHRWGFQAVYIHWLLHQQI